jgi:hypothetical protein
MSINVAQLQIEAVGVLINFGNKTLYSGALGKSNYQHLNKDRMRLNYLYGAINNVPTQIEVLQAIEVIRHYQCGATDLSSIGASPSPTPPSPTPNSYMRVGKKTVTIGATSVTFTSPLPSDDYTVTAWVIGAGESQYDLGTLTLSANGFTASDISINGTLHYQAIMNQ